MWTEELSETCRVLLQNKFEKLVHLVGFIIRQFTVFYIFMMYVLYKYCCSIPEDDPQRVGTSRIPSAVIAKALYYNTVQLLVFS
jgi:hypothetical protein